MENSGIIVFLRIKNANTSLVMKAWMSSIVCFVIARCII